MKIVCAWCSKDIGKKDGKGEEGITHGVCQKCLVKLVAKAESGINAECANDGNSIL